MFNSQYEGNIRLNLINGFISVKILKEIKRKRSHFSITPFSVNIYSPRVYGAFRVLILA